MNQLAMWNGKAPLWVWPIIVCLLAWLFRRVWLGAGAVGFRIPWLNRSPLFPSQIGRSRKGRPPASPQEEERASAKPPLARWWNLFRTRTAVPQLITIRARKTLGPQQQVFILRMEHREYHVLSQAGVAPLVLSTRTLPSPGLTTAQAKMNGSKSASRSPRLFRHTRMETVASRRLRRDASFAQPLSCGGRPSFEGASK